MADFVTTEFFTPREKVRLWRLADKGYCVFCEHRYDDEAWDRECPECGHPLLSEADVDAHCPICGYDNPLPKPLDAAFACQGCGKQI